MEELIKQSLDSFDDVWQRVTGRQAPALPQPGGREEDALLRLIHQERCAAYYAEALARALPGDGRALMLRHAAEAKSHLRRLRAEHFILTGVTGGGNEDCRAVTGKLALLRAAFLLAQELAAQYESAAEGTSCPELREVFAAFAQQTRRRAQEVRTLLVGNF